MEYDENNKLSSEDVVSEIVRGLQDGSLEGIGVYYEVGDETVLDSIEVEIGDSTITIKLADPLHESTVVYDQYDPSVVVGGHSVARIAKVLDENKNEFDISAIKGLKVMEVCGSSIESLRRLAEDRSDCSSEDPYYEAVCFCGSPRELEQVVSGTWVDPIELQNRLKEEDHNGLVKIRAAILNRRKEQDQKKDMDKANEEAALALLDKYECFYEK